MDMENKGMRDWSQDERGQTTAVTMVSGVLDWHLFPALGFPGLGAKVMVVSLLLPSHQLCREGQGAQSHPLLGFWWARDDNQTPARLKVP